MPVLPNGGPSTQAAENWGVGSDLLAFARQVHDATDTPLISAVEYRAVFDELAGDLRAHAFQIAETGKRVRDRCRSAQHGVSRADVNFVLRGLALRGHVFGRDEDDAASLSRRFAEHVLSLCLREQMLVSEKKRMELFRWIADGVLPPPP